MMRQAGRSAEMFAAVQSELDMSSEAFGVILEDCARTGNLTLAEEAWTGQRQYVNASFVVCVCLP